MSIQSDKTQMLLWGGVAFALLWGLLACMGDAVGARAFRGATLVIAILDGVSGIGLLIGTAWSVTRWMERTESH